MQKSLRINLFARNQAIKRGHENKAKKAKEEWQMWQRQKVIKERAERKYIKEERKARREDWLAGPLAPNRNSGGERGVYGTIEIDAFRSPEIPEIARGSPTIAGSEAREWDTADKSKRFKGRTIVGNVVVNDRVAVVHGPDRLKGLVGTVMSVDEATEEVRLSNLNTIDVRVPSGSPQNQGVKPALIDTREVGIPMSWVRLVVDYADTETGEMSPVIIRHVHAGAPYVQRALESNLPAHTRYVTGSETFTRNQQPVEIPWPEEERSEARQRADVDTDRSEVGKATWQPVMGRSPLGYGSPLAVQDPGDPSTPYTAGLVPSKVDASNVERAGLHGFVDEGKAVVRQNRIAAGIMDELRNKTKPNNTTHDVSDWVKTKMLEDARAIWWRDRKIASPFTEAKLREAEEKKKQIEAITRPWIHGTRRHILTPEIKDLVQQIQQTKLEKQPS